MARIEKAKGRRDTQSPSGYTRIFGISKLGHLMSRIQGTVISAGTELETLIWERVRKIENLDSFIQETIQSVDYGIYVARKKQVKESRIISSQYEPDFLAFSLIKRECYVIEVKDGDQFDTKKASGEHANLHNFATDISQQIPFSTRIYICSFNARTKEEIYIGLKQKFSKNQILTGRELCELFGINYDEIVKIRMNDQQSNLEYFTNEILKISEMNLRPASWSVSPRSSLRSQFGDNPPKAESSFPCRFI